MSALEQLVANMTVAQLAETAGLSLTDVVGLVLGPDRGGRPAARAAAARAPRTASETPAATGQSKATAGSFAVTERKHHTRTQAGRDALDAAITTFLKQTGERMRAVDIRDAVGGTPAQVRARLNALIEEGRVAYEGQASGTRYWVK